MDGTTQKRDSRSCSWPNNFFLTIIKYPAHAFVLWANTLIVFTQHAGTGKVMTCILMLSHKERDFIYHCAFTPSLATQPSHVNKHNRPEALLKETELNIPQHTCLLFCFDWVKNGKPFLRTGTDTQSAPAHLHGQTPHYPLFQSRALWASCRCIFFKRSKLSSHSVFSDLLAFMYIWDNK